MKEDLVRTQPAALSMECLRRWAEVSAVVMMIGMVIAGLLLTPARAQDTASVDVPSPVGPAESVIGGFDAAPGAFPSVVAIVREGRFSPAGRQFCGGTIVSPTWILTAAHCLFDSETNLPMDAASIRVIGGIENLRFDTNLDETVVTNIIVHPDYAHATSTQNDIALLELATPLSQPVTALYLGEQSALDGVDADIVGWGATFFVNPSLARYPDQLQTAIVPIVPLAVCNAPQSYNNALIDSQMCAGFADGGVDSCAGDSGGPLYITNNGVRQQAGIVSFGRGCAEPELYGIYTSITAFSTWLSQYITLDGDQPRGPSSKPVGVSPEDGTTGNGIDGEGESSPFNLTSERSGGGAPNPLLVALLALYLVTRGFARARTA